MPPVAASSTAAIAAVATASRSADPSLRCRLPSLKSYCRFPGRRARGSAVLLVLLERLFQLMISRKLPALVYFLP